MVFAVRVPGESTTTWFSLKSFVDLSALGPPSLRKLDVTVLHGVILGPLLGIDAEALANQSFLGYTHDTTEAIDRIAAGEAQAGFLMNATSVEQVLAACEAGFVLPQKSTYFQPKLATGLVMYRLDGPARTRRAESPAGGRLRRKRRRTRGGDGGQLAARSGAALPAGAGRAHEPGSGAARRLPRPALRAVSRHRCGNRRAVVPAARRAIPRRRGVAVELQPRLAALAARGRDDNGWRDRLEVAVGDVRAPRDEIVPAGFDLVATNPPYRPLRDGNPSPHPERALAHHEIALTLDEWLDCAAGAVRPGGRVAAILPAARTGELVDAMRARTSPRTACVRSTPTPIAPRRGSWPKASGVAGSRPSSSLRSWFTGPRAGTRPRSFECWAKTEGGRRRPPPPGGT